MQQKDLNKINFLLISDIHMGQSNLEKLKTWMINHKDQYNFDYILAMGDFDNLPNKEDINNKEMIIQSERKITDIFEFFEFLEIPLLYVPGNHDPITTFVKRDDPKLQISQISTKHSLNIHKQAYKLTNNLQLIGCGGSIPAHRIIKNNIQEKVWDGFPFSNDADFGVQLNDALNYNQTKNFQNILITHIGPYNSSTTQDSTQYPFTVFAGSQCMQDLIEQNKYDLLLNIHGHIHNGVGMSVVNKVRIINPGSLNEGNFAILKLSKKEKWNFFSSEFINLNDM